VAVTMIQADPPRDLPVIANVIVHVRGDGAMAVEKWPTRHLFDPQRVGTSQGPTDDMSPPTVPDPFAIRPGSTSPTRA